MAPQKFGTVGMGMEFVRVVSACFGGCAGFLLEGRALGDAVDFAAPARVGTAAETCAVADATGADDVIAAGAGSPALTAAGASIKGDATFGEAGACCGSACATSPRARTSATRPMIAIAATATTAAFQRGA